MSFPKLQLCPTNCLRTDAKYSYHLCDLLRVSEKEIYPNMHTVLLAHNPLPNNELLAQINNRYTIDDFFLHTIKKNINEMDDDNEMKKVLVENFRNLVETLPGDHSFLFDPLPLDFDFDDG